MANVLLLCPKSAEAYCLSGIVSCGLPASRQGFKENALAMGIEPLAGLGQPS
jgi:hypothetical protein